MNPGGAMAQVHDVRVVQAPTQHTLQVGRGVYHTGIIQIVTGMAAIIFNFLCTVTTTTVPAILGPGYWCGVMFIIAGCFGVAAYKKKSNGYIVTYMVLSIISAVFTIFLLVTGPMGIAESAYYCEYKYKSCHSGNHCGSKKKICWVDTTGVVMNSMLLICGMVELVVAITASAFCCAAVCCKTTAGISYIHGLPANTAPPMVVYAHPSQYPMYGKPGFITGQPAPVQPVAHHPLEFPGQTSLYPALAGGWQNGTNPQAPFNQPNANADNIQNEMSSPNAASAANVDTGDQPPPAYSYY